MTQDGRRMPPLGAGRKPAGLALLGWLDDPRAPRLCRVAGPPGAGKSHLLAWLVRGCTTETVPGARRIHAVLPAAGATVRTAVWSLGRQLDLVAHAPGPLVEAIAADGRPVLICIPGLDEAVDPAGLVTGLLDPLLRLPGVRLVVGAATGGAAAGAFTAVPAPAVLDLGDPQWTDRARFDQWAAVRGGDAAAYPLPGPVLGAPAAPPAPLPPAGADLRAAGEEALSALWAAAAAGGDPGPLAADPLLYALADPVPVTAAVERRDDAPARAWRAAGPAVIDEPDPAVRAAVLRTRLLGADPVAAAAAAVLAQLPAPWSGRWARWEGADPDWPGPAVAITAGAGPYLSQVLVADPTGAVRTFDAATGRRAGAVVVPAPRPLRGLAVTAGGSVVLLDAWGRAELVAPAEPRPGLEPYGLMTALDAVRSAAGGPTPAEGPGGGLSAVAAIGGLADSAPAFGDAAGAVHWYEDGKVVSERLHHGPVTALAGTALGGGPLSDPEIPLLASGGFDGAVRLWGPRSGPMPEPSDRRGCPVTAVAAGTTAAGPVVAAAWSDGLVRVRDLGTGRVLDLRTGSEVWSLALAGTLLVLGMPDGLAAVDTRG
ncbi:hypothetical protein RMN57_22390 [Kitasatospora sp. CM 4170]|uniref:Uncharacterized protein n=1 Tax=Kitasatospora aburaviensis TaxID=67265 RepID=A0ABW1F1A4_9ACTN|nr:hypothetical protein [Kitasatospora sp. CM 4170]WNM47254.1 hypothetical protein RMN57_22390 [Kitasatospora sp. CM 4170]